jgi:hypothetical protein
MGDLVIGDFSKRRRIKPVHPDFDLQTIATKVNGEEIARYKKLAGVILFEGILNEFFYNPIVFSQTIEEHDFLNFGLSNGFCYENKKGAVFLGRFYNPMMSKAAANIIGFASDYELKAYSLSSHNGSDEVRMQLFKTRILNKSTMTSPLDASVYSEFAKLMNYLEKNHKISFSLEVKENPSWSGKLERTELDAALNVLREIKMELTKLA